MAATPSPNFNDSQLLASDPTFQNRVRQSLIVQCLNAQVEDPNTVPFHRERETWAAAVMNSPDSYKETVACAVAGSLACVQDATVGGTVPLTSGNVAAQAALVTDQHINAAIVTGFNSYFRTPAQ